MIDIKKVIYTCITGRDIEGARVFLILSSLIMAIMIFLPYDIMIGLPYTIFYFEINDKFWGISLLVYSILGIYLMLQKKKNRKLLVLDSYLGFFIWSILTTTIFYSSLQLPATLGPMLAGSFLSWWVLLRTSVDK